MAKLKNKKSRTKLKEAEAYTDEQPDLEEEKNPSKFDGRDGDLGLEFDSQIDEDEEIDEDLAFTVEDEETFGHIFDKTGRDKIQDEVDEIFDKLSDELEELPTEDEDNTNEEELRAAVLGSSKKTETVVRREARPEGIANMVHQEGEVDGVDISELVDGAGGLQSTSIGARKSISALEKQNPLAPPLPKRIQDRQIRKVGYANATGNIAKWDDLVYANRIAPSLEFGNPPTDLDKPTTVEDIGRSFEPETEIERELAAILESAGGTSEENIVKMEDEAALRVMTLAELKKKRGQLAKMRSLLFHHEIQAARLKKIKSKEYHRRLQRSIRKKALKLGGMTSDEAAQKMLEEMAYNRMKERLTQKHSTMNRFARRIVRRGWGTADESTKQALEEQLRQSQQLKQRTEEEQQESESGSSGSESEVDGEPSYRKTRKALKQVLEGEVLEENQTKRGLLALPFMKAAFKKQRDETEAVAKQMLHSIDGTKPDEETRKSRMQFGGIQTAEQEENYSDPPKAKRVGQELGKIFHNDNPHSLEPSSEKNRHSFLFRKSAAEDIQNKNASPVGEESASDGHQLEPQEIDLTGEKTGTGMDMTQTDLIQMAFDDDDVKDEFAEEKEKEVASELPKIEEISLLPGWGRWKDDQEEPKWMQEKREKNKKLREIELGKRRDAKKPFVFISESANSALEKYRPSRIPPGFNSAEEYLAAIRHPIGPETNTAMAFEDFIRPKVTKRKGGIIEPLKLNKSVNDLRQEVKECKLGHVKVRKIVKGEIEEQVKF